MITPVTHPGREVALRIYEKGMSLSQFAKQLDVSNSRISEIASEKRSITIDTAIKLAKALGTTPEYWLDKQQAYDLSIKQKSDNEKRIPSWKRCSTNS
jgi:addiction module HigA family antidote